MASSSKKQESDDRDDDERRGRVSKKLRSDEPDLTVVVGDEEFRHYSILLRYACDYFDKMLTTNMKERNEMKIYFPGKDPDEWKLVYPFLEPQSVTSKRTLNWENVPILLPWFHELGLDALVQECDACMHNRLGEIDLENCLMSKRSLLLQEAIQFLGLGVKFELPNTASTAVDVIEMAMFADLKCITLDVIVQLKQYLYRDDLWDTFKSIQLVPSAWRAFTVEERRAVVESPAFEHMVLAKSEHKKQKRKIERLKLMNENLIRMSP
jgi:hypothetical protein